MVMMVSGLHSGCQIGFFKYARGFLMTFYKTLVDVLFRYETLKEMEKKIERSYSAPMIKVLTNFIYFTFRLPGFLSIYHFIQRESKKARLLLIK